jgi:hypothetical protein
MRRFAVLSEFAAPLFAFALFGPLTLTAWADDPLPIQKSEKADQLR